MLTVPALMTTDGATIYGSDRLWYEYFCVADQPRLRRDDQGRPVFLLVKYSFSDEDQAEHPELGDGGGYLSFDTEFGVPPESLEAIRTQLQARVDADWQRLRNGTDAERALPGVAGTTAPPAVVLGEPTWTSGSVSMDAPQATQLVTHRVAEGTPSLLAGNTASHSMDLTPAGATFMEKVLEGVGADGSDLTPIQVGYKLGFWARLPAATIHVKADSEAIYKHVRKIMDGRGVDWCTSYDFQHTDVDTTTAEASGLITVHIDTGSASLTDEVLTELRGYALELIQQMIEQSFFTEERPDDATPAPNLTPGGPREKYLRERFDSQSMHLEVDLQQRSVVEWTVNPQTTLTTFFEGMSDAERARHLRRVPLTDAFFQRLTVDVNVFADFGDAELAAVEVELRYSGVDAAGERQQKGQTFTFTSRTPQRWDVALIGDEREYEWRYRVALAGSGFGAYSTWARSSSRGLNLSVPSPGRVKVDVVAGDIDFTELVQRVQVTLAYEDDDAGIAREERTVVLHQGMPEGTYERLIRDLWRQPVSYRRRFTMRSGEVVEDAQWQQTVNRQLLVNQPFTDVLRVRLLPAGDGWELVNQVVVDLRYRDQRNAYEVAESIPIRDRGELGTWTVVLRDKQLRDFEHRVTATYKDGRFEQSPWKPSSGEETLPITVSAPPTVTVRLVPDLLDFQAAPLTEVTLHYVSGPVDKSETFVFRSKEPQSWVIRVPEGAPVDYTYRVTHYPPGGEPVVLPEVREKDPIVVLEPYRAPKAGRLDVSVLTQLVDFAATPLVVVDLSFDDDKHDVHETGSLVFSERGSQSWSVEVPDRNQQRFGYTITYHRTDGTEQVTGPVFSNTPRVIVPSLARSVPTPAGPISGG